MFLSIAILTIVVWAAAGCCLSHEGDDWRVAGRVLIIAGSLPLALVVLYFLWLAIALRVDPSIGKNW